MKKLFLLLTAVLITAACAMAQSKVVSGTVVSAADDEPLAGATVMPIGGGQGTSTDIDGNFSLTVPDKVNELNVSYVGFNTRKVAVSSGKMTIKLESSENSLDEVMVVAYGTAKKSAFTGSATVISNDAIEKTQVTNVLDALSGKVAGLQLSNASGAPGSSSPTIRIRGFSSMNAGNSPLVIVDGAPYTADINTLNTNDIESMTVLKDAASNALYGARGANGVILITTKRAKLGEAKVTVDAKWGLNTRATQDYDFIKDPPSITKHTTVHFTTLPAPTRSGSRLPAVRRKTSVVLATSLRKPMFGPMRICVPITPMVSATMSIPFPRVSILSVRTAA